MEPLALGPKEPPGTLRLPAARKGRLGDGGCDGTASGVGWVTGPPQETRLQRDRRCRRGMEPEKERKRDRERVRVPYECGTSLAGAWPEVPPRGTPPCVQPQRQPQPQPQRGRPRNAGQRRPGGGGAPGRPPPDAYRSAPGVDAGAPAAGGRGDRTLAQPRTTPRNAARAAH